MASIDIVADASRRLPTIRSADWFLRIPLAAILIEQGTLKLDDMAGQAADFGIPVFAFFLATFAEIAGGIALIVGGLIRNNWMTDMLTRLAGLATTAVVAGVIIMIYYGPFVGWQLQGMMLAGGVFFLMRGNGDVKNRALI
ncbi:MAG: DoxX family membrane protein [Pseudomonadota bacterium]